MSSANSVSPTPNPPLPFPLHQLSHVPPLRLVVALPPSYPSLSPPRFALLCSWLTVRQLASLCDRLDATWQQVSGFQWELSVR